MADYKITVLEIGYGEDVPQSFYLGDFADPDVSYPVHPFSMTLLQGEGKNILIDTGINPEDPVKQNILFAAGIGHTHTPREILETVGVTPEDIDAVILTHAHFDHAGAMECYPNAVFYLQEREFLGWSEYLSDPRLSTLGMFSTNPDDIKRLRTLKEKGRLILIDGDKQDLFPGISVMAASFGHTFGMQMVMIENDDTLFIHVGDVANIPENIFGTEAHPYFIPNLKFGIGSPYYAIADYEMILKWSLGKLDKIIMTHDGTRRERYPDSVGPLGLGIYRLS